MTTISFETQRLRIVETDTAYVLEFRQTDATGEKFWDKAYALPKKDERIFFGGNRPHLAERMMRALAGIRDE